MLVRQYGLSGAGARTLSGVTEAGRGSSGLCKAGRSPDGEASSANTEGRVKGPQASHRKDSSGENSRDVVGPGVAADSNEVMASNDAGSSNAVRDSNTAVESNEVVRSSDGIGSLADAHVTPPRRTTPALNPGAIAARRGDRGEARARERHEWITHRTYAWAVEAGDAPKRSCCEGPAR